MRHILASLALAALALEVAAQAAAATDPGTTKRPPNIVLLFSDDAGFADFGFQEHAAADAKPLTPNLDALSAAGVRCTDAYVSGAVCSPSRAGLLTGRYQQRFGHERNLPAGYQKGGMDLAEKTVADRLQGLGYRTALVGKWHLGYPEAYWPNARGFGEFWGLLQGSRSYLPQKKPSFDQVLQHNGTPLPEGGHVTERLGEFAAAYVKAHRDEPFFLMVSFTATHGPLQPAETDLAAVAETIQERRRKNLGLLVGLDRAVGTILAAIDAAGLADDTLVVFSNDNGGQTQTGADNGPLRGRKGMVFEGGVRVPLVARWPGHIPGGSVARDPMILLDLLPTFVAAAGGAIDADWRIDGTNLLPRWTGAVGTLPERSLHWRTAGKDGPVAMRKGPWKLVWNRQEADSAPRLFDLANDLGEAADRSAQEPERLRAMLTELAAWEAGLAEPRW